MLELNKIAIRLAETVSGEVLDLIDNKKIGEGDWSLIMHWVHDGHEDFYDEAEELIMGNIRKAFEKAFPGEKLDVNDDFNTINLLEHEINHLVTDPDFDLKGLGGKHGLLEGAVDELSLSFMEYGKLDAGVFSSVSSDMKKFWTEGATLEDFLKALSADPFVSSKKKKHVDNAISNIRHARKAELGKALDERLFYDVCREFVTKFMKYIEKDLEISIDPAREAKFKTFKRLLQKLNAGTLNFLKKKSEGTTKAAADQPKPKLTPGNGFFLEPTGAWGVKKIPPEVLQQAKFSGYLTIEGYRSSVFEMPDGSQWAQKSTGTPVAMDLSKIATRIAGL